MKLPNVSIKFCGGCNPRINRKQVAEDLCDLLKARGYATYYNRLDASVIVFISGCSAECARRYNPIHEACVSVAGTSVDGIETEERELTAAILNRVRGFHS